MSKLPASLRRDRAIRDAALELFKTDIAQLRSDLSGRKLGARVADRVGDGARDMAEEAAEYVEKNPGKLAAVVAASLLWLFRSPLLDWVSAQFDDDADLAAEQESGDDHWVEDNEIYGDDHDR